MIEFRKMESIPAGANPFAHDFVRMGIKLGSNVFVMLSNFEEHHCDHLVLVNVTTGERVRIGFAQERTEMVDEKFNLTDEAKEFVNDVAQSPYRGAIKKFFETVPPVVKK